MMETLKLNGTEYTCKKDEFVIEPHFEYNSLKIYPKVGELERIIGLLNDLTENKSDSNLLVYGWNYGGFVPIGCSKIYENIYIHTTENIVRNSNIPKNIHFNSFNLNSSNTPYTVFIANQNEHNLDLFPHSYILCNKSIKFNINSYIQNYISIAIVNTDLILHIPIDLFSDFNSKFWYFFDDSGAFNYDNLIHLCIMVKNGGVLFEKMLTENLPFIDRWTILDTGSTDGTQEVAKRVLSKKKGTLYEEPFINFRDSRNRCLDLAGKYCKYLVMLDDTYALRNDLRKFLNTVRGDQFASSYSLLILSDDVEYYSNRVTMSERSLRYIYTIHEVITDINNKENVVIPKDAAYIHDHRAEYMEKRTNDRKQYDLKLLFEMVRDDPTNPRHYYYLAQTYNCLGDHENAAYWFKRRATTELKGHDQEAVDSWFEYARTLNFKLNRPWDECKKAYEECFKMDTSRPDALYFLGIHYYLENDYAVAYDYFKRAFVLGYPIHAQFSLKPTLTFHFLPKFLAELCYRFDNWQLGLEACQRFLSHNNNKSEGFETMVSWLNVFTLLCKIPIGVYPTPYTPKKPIIAFVADGNWSNWTGRDILTKGLGGSETYIVEIARWVQASGHYNCIVFCKCDTADFYEGVRYMPIQGLPEYIVKNPIHTAIVSRFSEYVPLMTKGFVNNIYLVLHDLGPTGNIIPLDDKLRKVICLTKWHEQFFLERFPSFKGKTDAFYYGIDEDRFKPGKKVRNSFIYSSFPNRGLLPLLQMWPKIKHALPDATLNVYSDINGKWVNEVAKDQMDEIRRLIGNGSRLPGVTIHGWVSKPQLAEAWSHADIWLYPCIFQETFCLTALEAAASQTLAIGTPLAALTETIGNRGILVPGNPLDSEWQDRALKELLAVLGHLSNKFALIQANYKWAIDMTWKKRGQEFIKLYLPEALSETSPTYTLTKQALAEQTSSEDFPFVDVTLNYAGMYNWAQDLPKNTRSREKFLEALAVANPQHILEIGTFAGTSLIEMMRLYPNASAVAIDSWKNYDEENLIILKNIEENNIEKIFHENIRRAGLSQKVRAIKGDSVDKLTELIQQGELFDFIYVDGSHKCLDCYADMILGWKLLSKGGVMAVDDVLYNYDKVFNGEKLEYPLFAKYHFVKKYEGQFKVISDSYRLFIQKL